MKETKSHQDHNKNNNSNENTFAYDRSCKTNEAAIRTDLKLKNITGNTQTDTVEKRIKKLEGGLVNLKSNNVAKKKAYTMLIVQHYRELFLLKKIADKNSNIRGFKLNDDKGNEKGLASCSTFYSWYKEEAKDSGVTLSETELESYFNLLTRQTQNDYDLNKLGKLKLLDDESIKGFSTFLELNDTINLRTRNKYLNNLLRNDRLHEIHFRPKNRIQLNKLKDPNFAKKVKSIRFNDYRLCQLDFLDLGDGFCKVEIITNEHIEVMQKMEYLENIDFHELSRSISDETHKNCLKLIGKHKPKNLKKLKIPVLRQEQLDLLITTLSTQKIDFDLQIYANNIDTNSLATIKNNASLLSPYLKQLYFYSEDLIDVTSNVGVFSQLHNLEYMNLPPIEETDIFVQSLDKIQKLASLKHLHLEIKSPQQLNKLVKFFDKFPDGCNIKVYIENTLQGDQSFDLQKILALPSEHKRIELSITLHKVTFLPAQKNIVIPKNVYIIEPTLYDGISSIDISGTLGRFSREITFPKNLETFNIEAGGDFCSDTTPSTLYNKPKGQKDLTITIGEQASCQNFKLPIWTKELNIAPTNITECVSLSLEAPENVIKTALHDMRAVRTLFIITQKGQKGLNDQTNIFLSLLFNHYLSQNSIHFYRPPVKNETGIQSVDLKLNETYFSLRNKLLKNVGIQEIIEKDLTKEEKALLLSSKILDALNVYLQDHAQFAPHAKNENKNKIEDKIEDNNDNDKTDKNNNNNQNAQKNSELSDKAREAAESDYNLINTIVQGINQLKNKPNSEKFDVTAEEIHNKMDISIT